MTTPRRTNRNPFSVFRIALIAGAIGLGFIAVGVIIFLSDQASRRVPFEIQPFEGAQPWAVIDATNYSRTELFRVPNASPDEIAAYYQFKMNEHYGDSEEQCVRIPPTGEYPVPPDNPRAVPYQYKCMFDNSGFNTTQYTQVVIYPGLYSDDPTLNSQGMAIIEYQQRWAS